MTHVEISRINDLIGLQIGAIQEEAQKLNVDSDLQKIEANIAALEDAWGKSEKEFRPKG
jgi:hypothetical protein